MQGGAYGVSMSHSGIEQIIMFSSYRDPSIGVTLSAFRGALEQAREEPHQEVSVERAIVGVVGAEERPHDPGTQGIVSLRRRLYGITDELRGWRRKEVLAVTPSALSDAASRLLSRYAEGVSAVIAGEKAISEAATDVPGLSDRGIAIET